MPRNLSRSKSKFKTPKTNGSNMLSTTAILGALLATAVSNVAAVDNNGEVSFVLGNTAHLLHSRMDPIVNPGEVSGHMHQILGASNFRDVLNSPEEMQRAHCSSTKISADKSNYWTPNLYFMWPNGTYTALTSNTRIYYDLRPSDAGQKVTPFPDGLRMLSGMAMDRDEGAEQAQGVRISYNRDHNPTPKFLPRKRDQAPNQVIMSIFFPRCGLAEQLLDSPDHFSHMAHPVSGVKNEYNVASDKCPDTHPIMYPKVLIETLFEVTAEMKEKWNPNDSNFILSNGDVTGLSYHGDFVNGWDRKVIQAVIDQDCRVGDNLENCRAFDGLLDKNESRFNCRYQGQILSEDVGFIKPLSSLPGCNAKWGWDDGPTKPKTCPENKPTPGYVSPQFQLETFYGITVPLAVPGYKEDPFNINLGDLASVSRGYGARVNTWGATRDIGNYSNIAPVDQPMELEATQADVDAAASQSDNNKHPVVQGLGDKNEYTATKAAQPVDLAQATKGAGSGHYELPNLCDFLGKTVLPCGVFNRTIGIFGGSTQFAGLDGADTNAKAKVAKPAAAEGASGFGFAALPTESASAASSGAASSAVYSGEAVPSSSAAASSAAYSGEAASSASAPSAVDSGEAVAPSASAASSAAYSGEAVASSASASSAAYSGEAVPSDAAASSGEAAPSASATDSADASASADAGSASAAAPSATEGAEDAAGQQGGGKCGSRKHRKHGNGKYRKHGKTRRSRMRSSSHM